MLRMTFRVESARHCVCYVKPDRIHAHWIGFDAFDRPYNAIVDDMGAIVFVEFHDAAIHYGK